MQLRTVVLGAGAGVILSSAVAMAVPVARPPVSAPTAATSSALATASHVTAGRTLVMDARLGHSSLASGAGEETFLFASVTGLDTSASAPAATAPPLDLAIVIDRSGSMKGERIANALAAAISAVERMRDGDNVVVVAFDTEAQVVVPVTAVGPSTRSGLASAIRSIRLGGDTCISCGLEQARKELDRAPAASHRVTRMMLLSDGATNHGIRDVPGLRGLASRMRDRGCAITTIGVDVDFDEKVMGALAAESNGNHYFVANAAGLPAVFHQEFDAVLGTIAREAVVVVEPAAGVEIVEVFDRPSHREGSRLIVPLGSFSAKDEKSVLMKLRVAAEHEGVKPVVDIKLAYRDLVENADGSFAGALSLGIRSDGTAQPELDPFVRARVERSTTARALDEANDLVARGQFLDARVRLATRAAELQNAQASAQRAPSVAPRPQRARSFGQDFDDQAKALESAGKAAGAAASASPTSRSAREAPKKIASERLSNPFR